MRAIIVLTLYLLSAARVFGGHGVALLIGNCVGDSSSPASDLRTLAARLQERGYATTVRENLAAGELRSSIERFIKMAPTHGVVLVYVSGQVKRAESNGVSRDYLMPSEPESGGDTRAAGRLIGVDDILQLLRDESAAAFSTIVLDGGNAQPTGPPDGLERDRALLCYASRGFALRVSEELVRNRSNLPAAVIAAAARGGVWASCDDAVQLEPLDSSISAPTEIRAGGKAGDQWVNPFGTVFCWCPPGILPRAEISPEEEKRTETSGFWLGKYELTKREFDLVTRKNPKKALALYAAHPRDGIRYDDILATRTGGKRLRL